MKSWLMMVCLGLMAVNLSAEEPAGAALVDMEQFLPAEVGLILTYSMSGRVGGFEANIACTQVEKTANGKLVVLVEQSRTNTISRAVLVARAGRILYVPIDSPNVTNPPALTVADLDAAVTRGWAELVAATNADHAARSGGFWAGCTLMSLVAPTALPKAMQRSLPSGEQHAPDLVSVRATGFGASLCRQFTGGWCERSGSALLQRGVGVISMGTWDQTRGGNFAGCSLVRGVLPAARTAANPPPSLADPVHLKQNSWRYQVHQHEVPDGRREPYGLLLYQDEPLGIPDRHGRTQHNCLLTPWGFLSRQTDGSWLPSSLWGQSKPVSPAWSNVVVRLPTVLMEEPLAQVLRQTTPENYADPRTSAIPLREHPIASVVAKATGPPQVKWPRPTAPYMATQSFRVIGNLWKRSLARLPVVGEHQTARTNSVANVFEAGQVVEVVYKFYPWERPVAQDEQVLWKLCRASDRVWGYQLAKDSETNRVQFSK
jgi:hypothetical protein